MSEALILIDIQNDYFPGGAMEVFGAETVCQQAQALLATYRARKKLIIHIQHISTRAGATFYLPGTTGVDIHAGVRPLAGEKVITKNFPNSFRNTELGALLHGHGIKKIAFCGMMLHMCVDATVRAAFDHGLTCVVAADACATRDLAHDGVVVPSALVHAAYMAALGAVYAEVIPTTEIIVRLNA